MRVALLLLSVGGTVGVGLRRDGTRWNVLQQRRQRRQHCVLLEIGKTKGGELGRIVVLAVGVENTIVAAK